MGFRTNAIPINSDGVFDAAAWPGCVAYSIFNKGTANMIVMNNFPLNPGDAPLCMNGWPGIQRIDTIEIRFVGAGTKQAYILYTVDTDINKTP